MKYLTHWGSKAGGSFATSDLAPLGISQLPARIGNHEKNPAVAPSK
ncbi:MAG: hypothetical protein KBH45_10825 [Verrucomicrobia bacterium]|nr:hypothetical protein [Verrucomicrobiota bacterium]